MRKVSFLPSLKKGPFPEKKHLGYEELLQLKDEDVKPIKDVGGEFGDHEEEEVEVD